VLFDRGMSRIISEFLLPHRDKLGHELGNSIGSAASTVRASIIRAGLDPALFEKLAPAADVVVLLISTEVVRHFMRRI
jgi:hypothetical protein